MFIDWTIPLLIAVVGGPLAIIVKVWYKRSDNTASKFADNGTYVRDDSLYSYDEAKPSTVDDGNKADKNS